MNSSRFYSKIVKTQLCLNYTIVGTIPLNEQCGPTDRCEDPNADCMGGPNTAVTLCLCVDTHFEKARSGFCSKLSKIFNDISF